MSSSCDAKEKYFHRGEMVDISRVILGYKLMGALGRGEISMAPVRVRKRQ